MSIVVAPNQCSFVPGRMSSDNIILAQEIIHSMRTMKKKKGFMALKIDLEKAYDRVRWDFVIDCLHKLGLPSSFSDIVRFCLSTVEMQVLWNGSRGPTFKPNRDDLILFAEASLEQTGLVKACLDDFCLASGQKVNALKSRIFFSNNVGHHRRQEISQFLGFTPTTDLGKYLGVPLHHKRVNTRTYEHVLSKMDARLANWKVSTLSLAARHTLVSSVASAIPTYTMQSTLLPMATCDAIDKRCRGFLWGSQGNSRKVHLVAWDNICSPKEEGGLGLRSARKQNTAFMMKLGWGLIRRRDTLWVKFIREKYKCGDDIIPTVKKRRAESQVWKGIKYAWQDMLKGMAWKVGDGTRVRFWEDTWLQNHDKLSSYVNESIDESLRSHTVVEMRNTSGDWDWGVLSEFLPGHILQSLQQVRLDPNQLLQDIPVWQYTAHGDFTVRSAYSILSNYRSSSVDGDWRTIWKVDAPQRCKIFLWLCCKERLLTSHARTMRGMQQDDSCGLCSKAIEVTLHALRDCEYARSVWNFLVPGNLHGKFFNLSQPHAWVVWNLKQQNKVEDVKWSSWFAVASRQIWMNRNAGIFEHALKGPLQIVYQVRAIVACFNAVSCMKLIERERIPRWQPPTVGVIKYNVDGSYKGNTASCGGIARDAEGRVVDGFMFHIGNGNNLLAEI